MTNDNKYVMLFSPLPPQIKTIKFLKNVSGGISLAVLWLGLCTFTAEGLSLVSGQGNKIPRATQPQKEEKNPRIWKYPRFSFLNYVPTF